MIEVASKYCEQRGLSADYRTALHRVARSMTDGGVTPLTISDSSFNRWINSLPQQQTTRANYRRMGLTLWRAALDQELARHPIGHVVRVKHRQKTPVAWSLTELASLISHAKKLTFKLRKGCPASLFFEGWIRCGYETGLRFSDLLALRCNQLRGDRLFVCPNKTGVPDGKLISPVLVEILTKLRVLGDGQTFFNWALCERWLRIHFRRLCKQAEIDGTPKYLRRTGATYCERMRPGSAKRFLGHLSDGLALKHYVDPTLLTDSCPVPPTIEIEG